MIRYADRSTPAGTALTCPEHSRLTCTPAPLVRSMSRPSRRGPARAPAARTCPWGRERQPGHPGHPRRPHGRLRPPRPPRERRRAGSGGSRARDSGRSRHGGRRGVLLAQHAQHPAHLLERVPAGGLDRAEGVARVGGAAVDDVLAVAGLHGDDAHAVRHDVVQFPGDPQPLLGDGAARRLLLQHLRVQPPLPHRVAGHPADDQGERGGDQQARVAAVAGDPVVGKHDEHYHDERQPQGGAAGPPVAGRCHQVEHVGGGQEHDPAGRSPRRRAARRG